MSERTLEDTMADYPLWKESLEKYGYDAALTDLVLLADEILRLREQNLRLLADREMLMAAIDSSEDKIDGVTP